MNIYEMSVLCSGQLWTGEWICHDKHSLTRQIHYHQKTMYFKIGPSEVRATSGANLGRPLF